MQAKENRKTTRVDLENPVRVVLGSIGSSIRYDLLTHNISHNGFFLNFDKPGRFPFTPASIMEVWLELGEDEGTLFLNGKLARIVMPEEKDGIKQGESGIAIRIVQIDRENEEKLRLFIEKHASAHEKDSKHVA